MKNVVFVEFQGFKPLPSGESLRMMVGSHQFHAVTDIDAAFQMVRALSLIEIVVLNGPNLGLLEMIRDIHPETHTILCTEYPMAIYSKELNGKEDQLIDHIIANRNRFLSTINELRICIGKILEKDIFGIDKYLVSNAQVTKISIATCGDREELNQKVLEYAEICRLGHHTAKMAFGISEELIMNSVHDAPAAAGIELPERDRGKIKLRPEESGELTFCCDGQTFVIGCSDPFGALEKKTLFSYLKKVMKRRDGVGLIDTKKGGAGLGFFKILYSSHGIVCNVSPGKLTEVIAFIDIKDQLRDFSAMPRSIHYFESSA